MYPPPLDQLTEQGFTCRKRPYPDDMCAEKVTKRVKVRIVTTEIFKLVEKGAKRPAAYIGTSIASSTQVRKGFLDRKRARRSVSEAERSG